MVNHLAIVGTLDMDVMKSLANKNKKQEGLMQAIKTRIKAYENSKK